MARPKDSGPKTSLPRQGLKFFIATVLISLLVHFLSYVNLNFLLRKLPENPFDMTNKAPIKIKISPKVDEQTKRILEAHQKKTESPDHARYKGAVEHKTEKETKVSEQKPRPKAADPGERGTGKQPEKSSPRTPQKSPEQQSEKQLSMENIKSLGKVAMKKGGDKKSNYEKLMPTQQELAGQINAGYQDYIDEEIDVGDKIDINTSEFRYLGYFVNMRKSIELVWNYPMDAARRGLQGEVGLEFMILKDGSTKRVRVIKSSGYPILDNAIVEAIKLASPFSPLPESFRKDKMVVTGNFRYVLNSFAAYH